MGAGASAVSFVTVGPQVDAAMCKQLLGIHFNQAQFDSRTYSLPFTLLFVIIVFSFAPLLLLMLIIVFILVFLHRC